MSNRRERDSQLMDRVLLRAVQLLNHGDNTVPDCSQPPEEELPAILREEVEIAVAALKKGEVCSRTCSTRREVHD